MNKEEYMEFLDKRFGGKLLYGKHEADGEACLVEVRNVLLGNPWSDDPGERLDLRMLNDARWSSDEARTKALVPVELALWDWPKWDNARKSQIVSALALRMIREVLPIPLELIGLRKGADACRAAADLTAARSAARSAYSSARSAYSAADSAYSAYSAADSARSAADSAYSAADSAHSASDSILRDACAIFVECANQ